MHIGSNNSRNRSRSDDGDAETDNDDGDGQSRFIHNQFLLYCTIHIRVDITRITWKDNINHREKHQHMKHF